MAQTVVGREAEVTFVRSRLADDARSPVVVLEGQAGIGKSTILRVLLDDSGDLDPVGGRRMLRCRAAEPERHLSFTGLVDLLSTVATSEFRVLPAPQALALERALLRSLDDPEAAPPDPEMRTVGTALTSLLIALSATVPVIIAVDDAQWLDRASAKTLAFALRRLQGHRVAVIATVRQDDRGFWDEIVQAVESERVHSCPVGPLSTAELQTLLRHELGNTLTGPLFRRIERASGSNPLFALELARAVASGGVGALAEVPPALHGVVQQRLSRLPADTLAELQRASALAAPTTRVLNLDALGPAEQASIVSVRSNGAIEFTHPAFATAAYSSMSPPVRRKVHAELAELIDDPQERVQHLLGSTFAPDEAIAQILDDAVFEALRRGAVDRATEMAEEAIRYDAGTDPNRHDRRLLQAGRLCVNSGDSERAKTHLEPLLDNGDPTIRAEALRLMAQVVALTDIPRGTALFKESIDAAGHNAELAAALHLALAQSNLALMNAEATYDHAVQSLAFAERTTNQGLIAEALAMEQMVRVVSGRDLDEAKLHRALELEDFTRVSSMQSRPSLHVAIAYESIGQPERARPILQRLLAHLIEVGAESELAFVQSHLGAVETMAGAFALAADYGDQAVRTATLAGQDAFRSFGLVMRAGGRMHADDVAGAVSDASEGLQLASSMGWVNGVTQALWTLGRISLARGDGAAAADILRPLAAAIEAADLYHWPVTIPLPEVVEALAAQGGEDLAAAARLAGHLLEVGYQLDRPWALALGARCQAFVLAANGDLHAAVASADAALAAHRRLTMPWEEARTLFLLGQLQRRIGQRKVARATLTDAYERFVQLQSIPWARQVEAEIRRIGVRRAPLELTESERRVAELAAQGHTNQAIASMLFISRRTVEANLARAYRKLGVESRAALGALLGNVGASSEIRR